jgi:hypothetical protein
MGRAVGRVCEGCLVGGKVGGCAQVWLDDCGWQSWPWPEDERSTPQVGQ